MVAVPAAPTSVDEFDRLPWPTKRAFIVAIVAPHARRQYDELTAGRNIGSEPQLSPSLLRAVADEVEKRNVIPKASLLAGSPAPDEPALNGHALDED